jgi:hypothetical protein
VKPPYGFTRYRSEPWRLAHFSLFLPCKATDPTR